TPVSVPLRVASVAPATVTDAPLVNVVAADIAIVATLLLMFIERIPTGVFGVSTVGAGPALGMATPWPATKSPVPPAQVRLAEPEVVLQLMVGGVAAPA